MATIELSLENFEATTSRPGITIVDFWASWCGPCKSFAPIFEEVAEMNPEITFAKVDTEKEQRLVSKLKITAIPTIMIFRDGVQFYNEAGAIPKDSLEKLLKLVGEVDMQLVHEQIANQAKVVTNK